MACPPSLPPSTAAHFIYLFIFVPRMNGMEMEGRGMVNTERRRLGDTCQYGEPVGGVTPRPSGCLAEVGYV